MPHVNLFVLALGRFSWHKVSTLEDSKTKSTINKKNILNFLSFLMGSKFSGKLHGDHEDIFENDLIWNYHIIHVRLLYLMISIHHCIKTPIPQTDPIRMVFKLPWCWLCFAYMKLFLSEHLEGLQDVLLIVYLSKSACIKHDKLNLVLVILIPILLNVIYK